MIKRLRALPEWKFFSVLPSAGRVMAVAWWLVLALRALLPALFAIAMGLLVSAIEHGASLGMPLALAGTAFVLLQVLSPVHQAIGANLGSRTAAWLYDQLIIACVRPPGMGHLEDPRLTTDLMMARDFDLGISGPPLSIAMDFIASGLVEMLGKVVGKVVSLICAIYLLEQRRLPG
jgi:ATP-binding cassette, subfamily B, bacterial